MMQTQYFGDLKSKVKVATDYCRGYNAVASQTHHPHVNEDAVVNSIVKAHKKFYGEQSKYDGKGRLK